MEALLRDYLTEQGYAIDDHQITQLSKYASLLRKWNRIANLVGSASAESIVNDHIGDCVAAAPFVPPGFIADIGSGAGLPGLVFAILNPQTDVALVESRQRKSRFLQQVVIELALGNASVVAQRAEHWAPSRQVNALVCRGYSSLNKFVADTRQLHHPNLTLLAMKGTLPNAEMDELDSAVRVDAVHRLQVPGWNHRHVIAMHCVARR